MKVTREVFQWIISDYVVDTYLGDDSVYNPRNVGPLGEEK
jgi:hypothetical protein